MSTAKDNNPGLLSKVAKFVRNPTTNWSDLDVKEPEPDVGYSKQALKEMIERKRQNDFVRRREFDQLRKLRSRDPTVITEGAGRPSFYQSSLPTNQDERAVTLKKIDEIEAQMSKQWWKGKNPDAVETPPQTALPTPAEPLPAPVAPAVLLDNFDRPGQGGAPLDSGSEAHSDFALTQPAGAATELAHGQSSVQGPPTVSPATVVSKTFEPTAYVGFPSPPPRAYSREEPITVSPPPRPQDTTGSGFSSSRIHAEEMTDASTDPDIEEAAIRFANGDDTGAENGLLDALNERGHIDESAELWTAALFDLYRATGQQLRFDSIAIDFAERFGRSAPPWFSMPEQLGRTQPVERAAAPEQASTTDAIWTSPAVLDENAVNELNLALANAPLPWHLDWSGLKSITPDALFPLEPLLAGWCALRVRLRFKGAEQLEAVLKTCTRSGDKSQRVGWWQVRMNALRVMRLQDAFELVALDYCVTYEVSPPSWQEARCEYEQDGKSAIALGEGVDATQDTTERIPNFASDFTAPMGLEEVPVVVVELTGEILGDAADAIKRLEEGRNQSSGRLMVSCARLMRVDFSAAGSLLNWVANRQTEGCNVQFRDVHRLVGAFFNVIGINEHARVLLRSN
jgi:ABC-type transporter Mla MlaB component